MLALRTAIAAHRHDADAPRRVLVSVFDNRTGDASLQPLGRMAQDWLSQGLLRTRLVDVVDPRAALEQSRLDSAAAADPLVVAQRTGATLVVSGAYYRSGDTLFLQAAITDARTGRIAKAVGPVLSTTRSPVAGLDELRARVMTALATVVDLQAAGTLITSEDIPPFDAYQAYIDGWDAFTHGDGARAEALFLDAARRDTGFVSALLSAASSASNYSHCSLIDSLARILAARRRPLDRVDQLSIEISSAKCHGSNEEMLRLSLERAELLPRTSGALRRSRRRRTGPIGPPRRWSCSTRSIRRSISRTAATRPTWATGETSPPHCTCLAAHRGAGHRRPDDAGSAPLTRAWYRASALAALGRPTAALTVLDSALPLPVETANNIGLAPFTDGRPQYDATPGWIAWWVACELAVHGDTIASRQAAMRSVAWYRSRPADERATFEERLVMSWVLEMAGQIADADTLARHLLADDSTNVDVVGELASLAARRGDTVRADSLDRWLAAQPVSRAGWSADVYRAHLAALLGRRDDAVARVREALDHGAWPTWIHIDPALATLRSRADFVAMMKPRS